MQKIITAQNQKVDFKINNQLKSFHIKREDILGTGISGNKLRKLKYNVLKAIEKGEKTILTFGGAYSNQILAASFIKKQYGINVIGVIRGEELEDKINDNPTLKLAQQNGMIFHFISRASYKEKSSSKFIQELKDKFGSFYLLPEGGTNELAIKGCEEILTIKDVNFDYICTAVGTGGTIAGLINSSHKNQKILGFSSLKGDFLKDDIAKLVTKNNWEILTDYHFGGYAKVTKELIDFINNFKSETKIKLDPIYNGKMMFGIYDLMKNGYFSKNTSILAIHTGGLQAIEGMNSLLKKKGLPLINI
ncbi:pyridoxal-phosphate dependent enzyme [Flavobacteriaceae bacterium]|nr:pyridoxal-phosphate dependent enzyme [Flavobacteriaceae bacterium]